MDILFRNHRLFNILTISLPLFCFLLSWTTTTSLSSSSVSATTLSSSASAADILRTRGYTLFATTLSASAADLNLSGTLFAAPDFALAFSPSRRRKPTTSLLLFHTLPPPPLGFLSLSPSPFPTLYNNLCLFLSKSTSGELIISASASSTRTTRIRPIKVRQPDLYVDHQLAVHGIDGVLDPSGANICPTADPDPDEYSGVNSPRGNPQNARYLDHAIRVLRRRGFNFVATALAMRRAELVSLASVTVFAPSDRSIFVENVNAGGFRFDFLHHVVPQRLRFDSLSKQTVGFTAFETLAVNKSLIVEAIEGVVRVDGVRIDGTEIYFNRWIVVFAIPVTLDDATGGLLNPVNLPPPESETHSPPQSEVHPPQIDIGEDHAPPVDSGGAHAPPDDIGHADTADTPLTGSCHGGSSSGGDTVGPPSEGNKEPEPEQKYPPVIGVDVGVVIDGVRSQSLPPLPPSLETPVGESGGGVPCCSVGNTEGEDLYCPPQTTERKLQEADVEENCDPSDGGCKIEGKGLAESTQSISQPEVNIAADLFFYA